MKENSVPLKEKIVYCAVHFDTWKFKKNSKSDRKPGLISQYNILITGKSVKTIEIMVSLMKKKLHFVSTLGF